MILLLSLLEIVFVSALFLQLQNAESEAARESRQKQIYRQTQNVTRGLYSGHELLFAWQADPTPRNALAIRKVFDGVLSDLDYLEKNRDPDLKLDDKLNQLSSKTSQLFKDIYVNTESLSADPRDQAKQEQIATFMEWNRGPRGEVQSLAIDFLKSKEKNSQQQPESQDLIRKNLELIVLAGLSANIILAMALAQFFSSRINQKLQVILENTSKLRGLAALNPPLKGNDEICQLDHSFHFMAGKLIEHERLRRAYTDMFREELQSPLNDVFNNIAQLAGGQLGSVSEQAQKMIGSASTNLKRLIGIVDTLTQTGTNGAPEIVLKLSRNSMQQILDNALASVQEFAARRKIKLEAESIDCVIFADSDRIVQVLVNLLSNASKFSQPDSVVRIKTSSQGDDLQVNVIDTGRGVPVAQQKTIFEKFQQAEVSDGKRGAGTGLGLNICKQIIELHEGQIGVDSDEGKGSSFWFRIPINGPRTQDGVSS